jgi:hypothetical protein
LYFYEFGLRIGADLHVKLDVRKGGAGTSGIVLCRKIQIGGGGVGMYSVWASSGDIEEKGKEIRWEIERVGRHSGKIKGILRYFTITCPRRKQQDFLLFGFSCRYHCTKLTTYVTYFHRLHLSAIP